MHYSSKVSAGCGHSGFVTENGYAFTCGDNRYSQLGEYELFRYWSSELTEIILL